MTTHSRQVFGFDHRDDVSRLQDFLVPLLVGAMAGFGLGALILLILTARFGLL